MTAALRDDQGLTTEAISRWVQAYIDQGMKPIAAANAVIHDVCESGLQEDLLLLIGPSPVCLLWMQSKRGTHRVPAPAPPVLMHVAAPRRVDTAQLQTSTSLLEGLEKVGDSWVRIGDLTGAQCREVARQLKTKALEVAQNARYYHALGQALKDGETVRQRFGEDDLIRLFAEAGRA